MPHVVISHTDLGTIRRLVEQWDEFKPGERDYWVQWDDWATEAIAVLRVVADPRCALPDRHA